MDYQSHLEAIEREGSALVRAIEAAAPSDRVPSCPDWSVLDLGHHVGGVLGYWLSPLFDGAGRPAELRPWPAEANLAKWIGDLIGDALGCLRVLDAVSPVATWVPNDQTAGFAARRLAHELAVHRFDAQLAGGDPRPIEGALAADGIDEIFVLMAAFRPDDTERRGIRKGEGESLHLHATDESLPAGVGEWTINLDPTGVELTRAHAKADCAIKADASDLELKLYNRPTLGEVTLFGDESVLAAWYRAFRFG